MRVYVATSFANYRAAREAQVKLRAKGHHITHDWTVEVDREVHDFAACAVLDVEGVRTARALLYLAMPQCRGALVELGIAMALGKTCVVVDGEEDTCLFVAHYPAIVHVPDIDAAVAYLGDAR